MTGSVRKVAGDEARTVWGMGPLQKFASKRVEIGYDLSGRRWFVSLVRAESKQLEDVEGGHVLAGGRLEMMRWQCRFMHAQQEPYRLNQSDAHPRRNGDFVIAVPSQGDVGCFYSVLPADQSIRGWLGEGSEAREDINCRNAQTTPADSRAKWPGAGQSSGAGIGEEARHTHTQAMYRERVWRGAVLLSGAG